MAPNPKFMQFMRITDSCFPVISKSGDETRFLGSAFAVAKDGGLLTCRHVVESAAGKLGIIHFPENGEANIRWVERVHYPADKNLDLAFLPQAAAGVDGLVVWPTADPQGVVMAIDAYAFGYTARGNPFPVECGYHAGSVVAVRPDYEYLGAYKAVALSFPVLEGMSGCPLLTSETPDLSRRLIGVCCANESQRVLAHEIVQAKRGRR
jgi:hypothetical protein